MKCTLLTSLFVLCLNIPLFAAYLEKVPRTLIQPNGDTLHCFASGDEFYLRLHDAQNFTIVQNPQTGYFVYGMLEKDSIVPSPWIAGQVDPAGKSLTPGLRISREKYLQLRRQMIMPAKRAVNRDQNTNHGDFNNIAIFIRFADDTAFTNSYSDVQLMFNDSSENYSATSMFDYFKRTSYNQLFIRTSFYPEGNADQIVSYQDTFPRSYYMPWAETNPDGYSSEQRTEREHALLKRACAYVESMIPLNIDFDYNNDNYIDTFCFYVKADVGDWNTLLWPHPWSLYSEDVYIHGKRVYDYTFQLSDNTSYFTVSTLCHEMFHSLGAPDLYHYYEYTDFVPCGRWDLMAQNQSPPQQTCAYMKYKYGNWLQDSDIIPIEQTGTYTIFPLNSENIDRVTYRIQTQNPIEYILADYRSQTAPFDNTVPNRGVVFYRVNMLSNGNSGYNGDDNLDEIYVFRHNGSPTNNGNINGANFRGNTARSEFSYNSNPYPFISNGEVVSLFITNFTNTVDSIQFDVMELTSTSIEDHNLSLSLYPNPAHDYLTIEHNLSGTYTYQIFNMQGQLLHTQQYEGTTCQLSIDRYPSGCYFLKVTDQRENIIRTLKFIKQ